MARLAVVFGIATLSAVAILGYIASSMGLFTTSSAVQIGGPFSLSSARGGVVRSADLVGKPYGVFFGFTHCPEVCPTTMYEMSESLKTLGDAARDFRLFFITVDPERDTAEQLRDYLANFDPRMEALVPTQDQLPAIARQFQAIYVKVPTSDGGYTMDHTASVYLFGRDGRFQGVISFSDDRAAREAKLTRVLGKG